MSSIIRDENKLREAVAVSISARGTLELLGLNPAGGNYTTFRKAIKDFSIDISHFSGKGYLKGKTHTYNLRSLDEILVKGKEENTFRLKNRLLKEGIKKNVCEKCRRTKWFKEQIPLELHHADGCRTNNELNNLQLLCPNCHALTDNYRGKNKKKCRD